MKTGKTLLAALAAASLFAASAQAQMIGTQAVVGVESPMDGKRQAIADFAKKEEVAKQFEAMGLSAEDAQLRIAALTDEEVEMISQKMAEAPAGGILSLIVFVALVLLVTDIIGATNVYPFVKPVR